MPSVSRSSEGRDSLKKIKIKIMIDWTTKQAHQLLYATKETYFSSGTEGVHNVLVLDDLIFI